MASLGELCGKLSDLTIKLFNTQDVIHKAAQAGEGIDAETTGRLVSLNLQRNQVMTQIDECLDTAVREGRATVDPRIKIV